MIFPIKLINEITNVGYNLKRDSYNRIIFDEVTEPLSRLQWPMNHSERRVWMRRRNSPLTDPNRKPRRRSTLLNILTKRRGRAFPFTLRFRNILFQFSINVRLFLETIFAYPQFNFIANTFHKLFYFSKSRNTVQASFVPSTAFVLCERILIPVNRKDRKGPKRGLIRGAFPPYDLSVARKRQHLYTRNSCRYTAIGHSRAGLRHTYMRTTRTRYSDTKAGQAADRGLAREPLSMLVHVQPVRRFTVRRILRRRPLRRGQTSLWIL